MIIGEEMWKLGGDGAGARRVGISSDDVKMKDLALIAETLILPNRWKNFTGSLGFS